jgi:hypothetical protein
MNNEPVAYINVEERKLEWAKPTTWHTPTIAQMDKIPLYTHPAKTLTDEEIKQCVIKAGFQFSGNDLVFYNTGNQLLLKPNYIGTIADGLKDFAEELLKKAQEK